MTCDLWSCDLKTQIKYCPSRIYPHIKFDVKPPHGSWDIHTNKPGRMDGRPENMMPPATSLARHNKPSFCCWLIHYPYKSLGFDILKNSLLHYYNNSKFKWTTLSIHFVLVAIIMHSIKIDRTSQRVNTFKAWERRSFCIGIGCMPWAFRITEYIEYMVFNE